MTSYVTSVQARTCARCDGDGREQHGGLVRNAPCRVCQGSGESGYVRMITLVGAS
ncbi:MAG TPA: hypothetical protein VE869_16015 [Gemmatimonas sp.]|nr:hypothetical protein [Gemmatimonas sp.]